MTPRLLIIIGSTRPGRASLPIARWAEQRARERGGFHVEVADLADAVLPFLDEPHHPKHETYTQAHTKSWSAVVDAADAFVIVTPEYNHGYPGVLKNAIDYLDREWQYKPVAFISYGGIAAGTRAVQQLKQVALSLRLQPITDAVAISAPAALIDDGTFQPPEATERAVERMLDELARAEAPLAQRRRSPRPS